MCGIDKLLSLLYDKLLEICRFYGFNIKEKNMNQHNLPEPVLRRLPGYLHLFERLRDEGVERISSGKMAELMGATASQIRQDFSCFGKLGQQGYGYSVPKLAEQFAEILGINTKRSVILLGAGHLGRAIGVNFPFENYGFELAAAFDTSEELFGKELAKGVIIHDAASLHEYISSNTVNAAVLTVPQEAARQCARQLVDCGVKFLWNFSNIDLGLEGTGAVVEDVRFSDSLLVLSYLMTTSEKGNNGE